MNNGPVSDPAEPVRPDAQKSSLGHAQLLALLALLAALALGLLFAFGRQSTELPALHAGIALPQPHTLPEFSLRDHNGQEFTRASLGGRWTLVFAGFTSCPDICPTTLGILTTLDSRLQGAGRDIRVLFLGLDPQRDDPETLRSYLGFFNKDFLGATGESKQLDKLIEALGFAYVRVPTGAESYTIDHSTALALIDPEARLVGYFTAPHVPSEIAADLLAVLAAE